MVGIRIFKKIILVLENGFLFECIILLSNHTTKGDPGN